MTTTEATGTHPSQDAASGTDPADTTAPVEAIVTDHDRGIHGYHHQKAEHLKRLRRIEGQIRGLQRMVDEDVYCIDILTQVSASTKSRAARRSTRRSRRPPRPSPACCAPDPGGGPPRLIPGAAARHPRAAAPVSRSRRS